MSDLRVKSEIESLTEVVESLHVVKLFELIFASCIYLCVQKHLPHKFLFFFWWNLVSCQQLPVLPACVLACRRQTLSSAVTGRRNSQSPGTASSIAQFSRPPQPSSDNLRSVIQWSLERSFFHWNTKKLTSPVRQKYLSGSYADLYTLYFYSRVQTL